jgi:hypothetical protein
LRFAWLKRLSNVAHLGAVAAERGAQAVGAEAVGAILLA